MVFYCFFSLPLFTCSVLKKCGKKMPRYCDVNNDKRITLSEWLSCLQVQTNAQKSKASDTSMSKKQDAGGGGGNRRGGGLVHVKPN